MPSSIELLVGTVKWPAGKVFATQYGDRVNAVVLLSTGEEVKLWGSPGDPALTNLRKGQSVQLVKDNKGVKLAQVSQPTNPTNGNGAVPTTPKELSPEQKKEIANYINQQADIYAYCVRVVLSKFATPADGEDEALTESEESIRAIATTLYIQSVRKFNL